MGMKQTIDVINRMEADGIIGRYAIAGAVAAYNYVEPTVTEDVDILIAFDPGHRLQTGLITLGPILSYLKDKGYSDFRKEAFLSKAGPFNSSRWRTILMRRPSRRPMRSILKFTQTRAP